jgi:hypothetical protein
MDEVWQSNYKHCITPSAEGRKMYKVLVGKPEGKRPLGRPRRRWGDGMRIDLREIGCGVWIGFDWLKIGTDGELLRMW